MSSDISPPALTDSAAPPHTATVDEVPATPLPDASTGAAHQAGTEVAHPARAVAILADDLIWATRLADAVTAAGGRPTRLRRLDDLAAALAPEVRDVPEAPRVIVDLTARAYDGVEAIRLAAGTGARVVAVGQHDDVELRRHALAAGAERVYTYRALFEDGARLLAKWLA
jgi:DNA-binding NarL/FixJ family response regulator